MAVTTQTEPEDFAGPRAHGDPMGTPTVEEKVLWKGRPSLALLSRTAFHTRSIGLYFAFLILVSAIIGNMTAAIWCAVGGLLTLGILYLIAMRSVSTTLYILTDQRLIMRIGMAIETRINVPLKHVLSADLQARAKGHGDISLTLGGERLLGYFLLWPHVRPFRFARPEPMLRAIPEAQKVASLLADACARHVEIERHLSEVKVAPQPKAIKEPGQKTSAPERAAKGNLEGPLEGAPA